MYSENVSRNSEKYQKNVRTVRSRFRRVRWERFALIFFSIQQIAYAEQNDVHNWNTDCRDQLLNMRLTNG